MSKVTDRKYRWVHAAALAGYLVCILALYLPSLQFDENIDDAYYFTLLYDNDLPLRKQLNAAGQLFNETDIRPVTLITFILESAAFGHTPRTHHGFNLFYYFLLIIAVHFLVLNFGARGDPRLQVVAIGTALLFLIHPAHVNVVASMKNRESILSLLFAVLAMISWLQVVRHQRKAYLFPTAILLACGILAKRDVIPFLLILPLMASLYRSGSVKIRRPDPRAVIFVLLVISSVAFVYSLYQPHDEGVSTVTVEENPAALQTDAYHIFNLPQSLAIYEKFMVIPTGYYFYFGYNQIELWGHRHILTYLILILHLILWIYWFRRWRAKDIGVIGPMIFFVCILPFLNLFSIAAGIVAVRYAFAASLGFCLTVAWYSTETVVRWPRSRAAVLILWALMLSTFFYFARERLPDWRNKDTLFEADLPHLKRSAVANRMAAAHYLGRYETNAGDPAYQNDLVLAEKYNERSMAVYPREAQVLAHQAKILGFRNRHEEAQTVLRTLVEVAPNQIKGWSLLASHSLFMGNREEAKIAYERILEIDATQVKPYTELTLIYTSEGEASRADSLNGILTSLNLPEHPQLINCGNMALLQGDTAQAVQFFTEQLENSTLFDPPRFKMLMEYARRKGDEALLLRLRALQPE